MRKVNKVCMYVCGVPGDLAGQNTGTGATKLFGRKLADFPFPASFFPTAHFLRLLSDFLPCSAACLCLIVAVRSLAFPSRTCFKLLNSLWRMMEYLYLFLCEVSVDSSNHHTKAIRFVIAPVLLTNCWVKLLEDFVQGLRFVRFNAFVITLLCSPRLPYFLSSYLCFVRCFCSKHSTSNSELKYRHFPLSWPPFCFIGLSRLSCQSI